MHLQTKRHAFCAVMLFALVFLKGTAVFADTSDSAMSLEAATGVNSSTSTKPAQSTTSIAVAAPVTSAASSPGVSSTSSPGAGKGKGSRRRSRVYATPILQGHSDPLSAEMSPDAVQLADMLGLTAKLQRLIELTKDSTTSNGASRLGPNYEERTDLKFDVLETVEETRLQIDFVVAEIEEEEVVLEEGLRIFQDDRDKRVNRANQTAFRTNGVLWAVAEAFDILTYKHPMLSIPSGSVGILAGIVPSLFSGYATRSSAGGHIKREIYPNILTKIFDFPTTPRVEYPGVVWQYLNSPPANDTRTRRTIMHDHWRDDTNIHVFKDGVNAQKLLLLTGNAPYTTDIDFISDKLIMIGQIKAVVLQMSRPLLEICMVSRGHKRFPETTQDP